MKTAIVHAIAGVIIVAVSVAYYLKKETKLEEYELFSVKKLESIKMGANGLDSFEYLGVEINKDSLVVRDRENFEQSALSSEFMSKKRDDNNKTIAKINASLSKTIFSKLDKYKPFVMTTRVDGKDFTATFVPIDFGANANNGYLVCYRKDNTLVKIERDFTEKIFFIIAATLLFKALLMGGAAYLQNKKRQS